MRQRWSSLRLFAVSTLALIGCAASYAYLSGPGRSSLAPLADYEASAEHGRYLALAGNCATCHTAEGGAPYAGGVEFHTPFGLLYSTNITADRATGIGNWSFADFHASMKHGIRPNGEHLYPAFPYTDFAKLTDEDIASLYLYFQTVEPVAQLAPENALTFPFDQRFLLAGWKTLFHDPSTYTADTNQSAQWNRGAYLVEGAGHCGACHTPRNALGAERESLALTGGSYLDKVRFGYYRQWSGVNLTPHTRGLGAWSAGNIVAYLRDGISDNAVVHGPMNEVVMNSTGQLTEEDLQAMATYLKGIPANAQPAGPAPGEEILQAGETVYTVHCGSCHLPSGEGDAGLGVSLRSSPIVLAADASSLINVVLYGPHLPPRLAVDRSQMKMFGKRLSDEDIASAASYVRSEFGHGAGEVTASQVNAQR